MNNLRNTKIINSTIFGIGYYLQNIENLIMLSI